MEDLLAELLGALLEILGEVLLQTLFELAAETLTGLFQRKGSGNKAESAMRFAFFGALAGLLSAWFFPHRLITRHVLLPGVSLLLAPLGTGFVMQLLGKRLSQVGRYSSALATFRGGAIFAFSMALARWWFVVLLH